MHELIMQVIENSIYRPRTICTGYTAVTHMGSIVRNEDVEKCLRELLKLEGYELNKSRTHGETGVDILVKKEGEVIYIEVIGHKSAGPARARDFYESFFRAISRLNEDATDCVIAMPKQTEIGLPQRAKQYNVSWKRIGKSFSRTQNLAY